MISLPSSLLPVIDLQQGFAVHAVAGKRAEYQRLCSRWCDKPGDTALILEALRRKLNLSEFYVADLDAIMGNGNHYGLIQELIRQGFRIWLDAGVRSLNDVDAILKLGVAEVIVASETVLDEDWSQLRDHSALEKLVFSIDLYQGKLRTTGAVFAGQEPMEVVKTVVNWGYRKIIVLDIASVGKSAGCSTLPLCQQIKELHPAVELITGGGIRSISDITHLEQAGIERVLVSTWLHNSPTNFAPSPTA